MPGQIVVLNVYIVLFTLKIRDSDIADTAQYVMANGRYTYVVLVYTHTYIYTIYYIHVYLHVYQVYTINRG